MHGRALFEYFHNIGITYIPISLLSYHHAMKDSGDMLSFFLVSTMGNDILIDS